MKVYEKVQEINELLAQKLVNKGVSAQKTETTTDLVNKVDLIKQEQSENIGINPEWEDWRYFTYNGNRDDLVQKLKYEDTKKGINFGHMFELTKLTEIPNIDTESGSDFSYMFYGASTLVTIPELNLTNATKVGSMFTNCNELVNVTIAGEIKISGINFQYATKLSKDSLISIMTALSAESTKVSLTLSKSAVSNAFETSSGTNDGATSKEWLNLIKAKTNWTIALI